MPNHIPIGADTVVAGQTDTPDATGLREISLLADDLPQIADVEANNQIETAQKLTLPVAVTGVIDQPGDQDFFRLTATKDTHYYFEAYSRLLYLPLDAELRLFDAKGKQLAQNDDSSQFTGRRLKDPSLEWKAPADGEYVLLIRDVMGSGGPAFRYHLRLRQAAPDFALKCDPDLAMLGPGNRAPIFVRIHRQFGFDQPVTLRLHDLPAGVTADDVTIAGDLNDGCLVLQVADDAKPTAANFRIEGIAKRAATPSASAGEQELHRWAVPLCEIYQAQRRPARTAAVAVTEPSDILVETTVQELTVAPGGTVEIPVTIRRQEKYAKGTVNLAIDWRDGNRVFGAALPKEVTIDSRKSVRALNNSETEGKLTLTVAKDAKPIERVPFVVLANIPIEFSVVTSYCSKPIYLTIARPATAQAESNSKPR